jgi:hypothetical protein
VEQDERPQVSSATERRRLHPSKICAAFRAVHSPRSKDAGTLVATTVRLGLREIAQTKTIPSFPSPASTARLPFRSVQFCTDSAPADGQNMTMDEISFHRLKAERCARLAKDEPDTRRKLELETEGTLWLELADAEERLDEMRKKVQSRLNAHHLNGVAFAREPSRQANPIKGLDLDDPEARQRFIQGE